MNTILNSLGYDISEKTITSVLPLEEKINFEYCFSDNTFKAVLNHLIIKLSPFFCVVVDGEKKFESCLKLWPKRVYTFVEAKHHDDLKNVLTTPGILIFKNPSDSLITQLKPILKYKP